MAKEAKKKLENTEGKPLEGPEKGKKEEAPEEAEKPAEKVDELEALRQEHSPEAAPLHHRRGYHAAGPHDFAAPVPLRGGLPPGLL